MSIRYFLWLLCAMLPLLSKAQDYSFTHYDVNDGLAGPTVYCMLQDKKGFIWFGTETGVSRFDGKNFKNFSIEDGLPDNQIITMFEDSKGRIWMSPFKKSVCYYYNGKIYNQQNDPVLRSLKFSGHVVNFTEDAKGNILLMQLTRIHLIRPDSTVKVFIYPQSSLINLISAGTSERGNFYVVNNDMLYEMVNEKLLFVSKVNTRFANYRYLQMRRQTFIWRTGWGTFHFKNTRFDKEADFKRGLLINTVSILNDSMMAVNGPIGVGSQVYDVASDKMEGYLPNESTSQTYMDKEGNLWFCTLNHGVFMLNSEHIYNISLRNNTNAKLGAYAITKYGSDWLVGSDMSHLFLVKKNTSERGYNFRKIWMFKDSIAERVTYIINDYNGGYLVGTDSRVAFLDRNFKELHQLTLWGVKSLFPTPRHVIVATGRNVFRMEAQSYKVEDTLWNERSTLAIEKNDTLYIGTLDGLFMRLKDGTQKEAAPNLPQLRNRIMDIRQDKNGALWIATYAGVFCFNDGQIISSVTEKDGLVSNVCRTLDIFENELWIGTNKGLQKVNMIDPQKPVVEYLLSNELSSDIINSVKADSTSIMVATPEGISIIDKRMISFNSRCDLYMDNIIVSGRSLPWNGGHFDLRNRDNNIRFEYAGISYRSGGDVSFHYRLLGLDTMWRQTHDNYLNYPTLPAGDYQLQLRAVNKFGVNSNVLSVSFNIEKKLWQKTWFQAVFVLAIIVLAWAVFSWRIRVIRKQEAEKAGILKKISELEQLALKAQMNPHFIFNSLNSIQHYVLGKDIEGANHFITGFSRLIRQTLEISARHEITLAEEMNYLSTYLRLEQIRLENKFTFEVMAEPGMKPEECFIPPMILQPFVENSIRHGIRFRHDNKGCVSIIFKKISGYLECVVEDNGIGRKMAALHKSKNPIEYQSKGISLTTDRINLLNRGAARPIFLKIYDIENNASQEAGTKVVISFPV